MALPNVKIILGNGNLARVQSLDDGVSGLLLPGDPVADKLELNKHYTFGSVRDLVTYGITKENNPIAYKDILAFYTSVGGGAELHIVLTEKDKTLAEMCSVEDGSPLRILVAGGSGRIRLVGVNHTAAADDAEVPTKGISDDAIAAVKAAQSVAESFTTEIQPFRVLLPALDWDGTTEKLYKPREDSSNRVGMVLASDELVGGKASAAIGQVLGRAAKLKVHQSIARVREGSIASFGYLMDGKTPEDHYAVRDALDAAGYIFYRTFAAKNGYYINDDPMCAALSDDYSNLYLGRVIDKAILIAYTTYIDSVMDNIVVDEDGLIPEPVCKSYEQMIKRAVGAQMGDEISSFDAYVDPSQNVLINGVLDIECKIVPQGILREINVNLSFVNPQNK